MSCHTCCDNCADKIKKNNEEIFQQAKEQAIATGTTIGIYINDHGKYFIATAGQQPSQYVTPYV
jgi:aspartate/tyrosine/aromatic aminotransferase